MLRRCLAWLLAACLFVTTTGSARAEPPSAGALEAPSEGGLEPGTAGPELGTEPQLAPNAELARIEQELAALRASRPRLGLPVTLLAVGGGVSVLCGLLSLAVASGRTPSRRYAWDEDGNRYTYRHVDPERRDSLITFGTCTAVGLVVAGTGLGLLIPRSKTRKRISTEMRELRQRRDALQQGLSYSLSLDARALGGSVRFSF